MCAWSFWEGRQLSDLDVTPTPKSHGFCSAGYSEGFGLIHGMGTDWIICSFYTWNAVIDQINNHEGEFENRIGEGVAYQKQPAKSQYDTLKFWAWKKRTKNYPGRFQEGLPLQWAGTACFVLWMFLLCYYFITH